MKLDKRPGERGGGVLRRGVVGGGKVGVEYKRIHAIRKARYKGGKRMEGQEEKGKTKVLFEKWHNETQYLYVNKKTLTNTLKYWYIIHQNFLTWNLTFKNTYWGSYCCIALTGLEHTTQLRPASNLWSSCHSLPCAAIIGRGLCAWICTLLLKPSILVLQILIVVFSEAINFSVDKFW